MSVMSRQRGKPGRADVPSGSLEVGIEIRCSAGVGGALMLVSHMPVSAALGSYAHLVFDHDTAEER